jgi:hypothetical protein
MPPACGTRFLIAVRRSHKTLAAQIAFFSVIPAQAGIQDPAITADPLCRNQTACLSSPPAEK